MTTIAEFRLSGEKSACRTAFDRLPSLECKMEPVVVGDVGVWLSGAERSAVEDALAADPTVESHERLEAGEECWLYEVEFTGAFGDLFELAAVCDGEILGAVGREAVWTVSFRLSRREDVREVFDGVAARDLDPEVVCLTDPAADHGPSGLTAEQYETLVVAIDRGYFEIPRKISLDELAADLDLSTQTLSGRLQRAYGTLATTELRDDDAAVPA